MSSELVPAAANLPAHPDNQISDSTRDRIEQSVPENTRAAYERQWKAFTTWCSQASRTTLPATAETLAEYVGHLADLDRAPSTVEQGIAAIRTVHRHSGHPGLPDTSAALAVLKAHRQDRAMAGKRRRGLDSL